MNEDSRNYYNERIRKTIKEELTPQGDLLPPWMRYPQIPRYSIGWRMGTGEIYMWAWDAWTEEIKQDKLVQYFKKYLPIPLDWLDWVAHRLGFPKVSTVVFSGEGDIEDVHWLEEQGLVNFTEFKDWFDKLPKR